MTRIEDEEGSALIEMALISPLFILLLVGAINFGLALQQNTIVADSARAGVMYALTAGNATNTAQMQAVATASASSAKVGTYSAVATNYCTCSSGGAATVSCTSTCGGYGQPAMYAQVKATGTINFPFNSLAPIPISSIARVRISCPSC